ncbi:MAG: MBL fold metallo-hydrolase [Oscillospiraceae bacterium]|jgi:glyoxylase-like metal-dependent hydrolase (beta-lactamase superfamily II)|nr:MBL fold metallo-hydrolase [Oscillospiraceae bacterium]
MMKIHEIGSYLVRNYVLETSVGFIAIDTGYPGSAVAFIKRFEGIAPLDQLRYVFLTHAHDDHAGFLAELLGRTSVQVIMHPAGLPILKAGENAMPPGAGYSSRLAAVFGLFKKTFQFPPVEIGERGIYIRSASDQFFHGIGLPLHILMLPGHTADSIGLLNEENGELFCGDAAMNAVISRQRHTIWIDDKEAFGQSWDVMLSVHPTKIIPAHGNPFPPQDLLRYRHFLNGRQLLH